MELRKIDLNKIQDYAFTVRELESDELILRNQKYINVKCLDNESIIPTVEAIPLERVKQAKEEINKLLLMSKKDTDSYRAYYNSIEIVNMLMEGVEE